MHSWTLLLGVASKALSVTIGPVDYPPAPMNHVKYLRAGPAEMPVQNWYTANANHFRLSDFRQAEIQNTTGLSDEPSTA